MPCTRWVAPGGAERSGRWRDHAKTECGLHARMPLAPYASRLRPDAEEASAP
jgi:3'-phosphoadenosine 5'-phosphosulfate sulfotransferase (PAPS reductase)/FAD synthetase